MMRLAKNGDKGAFDGHLRKTVLKGRIASDSIAMNASRHKVLNSPAIRRMPSYLHWLLRIQESGKKTVSTTELADYMRIGWIVVRKDIALTGISGRPRIGYDIGKLIVAIRAYLGWQTMHSATLVGAGALGSAILGYDEFVRYGLNIETVFDTDPAKIGTDVHGHTILSLASLPEVFRNNVPEIAVLCVPASSAQDVADLLVAQGVRCIWNFANVTLAVPENVIVQREVLAGGLAMLSVKMKKAAGANIDIED